MALALLLLGGLVVASVFVLPGVVEPEAGPELRNSVRTTLLQASGGLVLVLGATATWRQLHINREGQITDRYTRGVEQLGADTVDVQLGGIYALERIAHDSPHDRPTIAEVLTAFVRHRAKPLPDREHDRDGPAQPLQTRLPAVQAAMSVLGRMPRRADGRLDLANVDLRGADLTRADLTDANLERATLIDANLLLANLAGAYLPSANLTRANLLIANLTNARLREANLTDANLTSVNLADAELTDADLTGVNLWSATLTGAHLSAANLTRGHLVGANLTGAELWGADLTDAALTGANLTDANLREANLTGARLEGARLSHARADWNTQWPEGFDPQAAGVLFEETT